MMITQQTLVNAMQSEDIAKSLYRLIPKNNRKDFIKFAESFGMSGRRVRENMARL